MGGRIPPPSSFRNRDAHRLDITFRGIRSFVSTGWPGAKFARLVIGCPEIERFQAAHPGKVGERSLMHVGHRQGVVCAMPICGRLPGNFIAGLFLHEFGHLATGGGEREADRWVFDTFGIRILYETDLDLECVDDFAMARILRGVKKVGLDLRHNR